MKMVNSLIVKKHLYLHLVPQKNLHYSITSRVIRLFALMALYICYYCLDDGLIWLDTWCFLELNIRLKYSAQKSRAYYIFGSCF